MKKILVVDDIKEITELVIMILETEFDDFEYLDFQSGNQVISYLKSTRDDIALIISDHNMPDGTGSDVYTFIKEQELSIPYIHMSTGIHTEFNALKTLLEDHPGNACMSKPFDDEILTAIVSNSLSQQTPEKDKFTRLNITNISPYIGDFFKVYIEVDNKPLLLFDESSTSDEIKLHQLKDKGLNEILIETKEYNQWIKNKITELNKIVGEYNVPKPSTLKELTDTLFRHSSLIINIANPKVLKMEKVSESFSTVLDTLWKRSDIQKEMIKVFSNLGYISGHSSICLILSWIYTKQHKNGDINFFTKLAHASLFHDVSLPDDESASLLRKEEVESSVYSSREKDYITNYPIYSAEKLEQWDVIDSDSLRIIREHHEMPNAKGFPKSLSSTNSHKLSTAFQLILNLAHEIYINHGDIEKVKSSIDKSFDLDDFKSLIDSLKRI